MAGAIFKAKRREGGHMGMKKLGGDTNGGTMGYGNMGYTVTGKYYDASSKAKIQNAISDVKRMPGYQDKSYD